jgi:hypothetical protein
LIVCLDDLNAPERRLWDSFSQGRAVDVLDDPASAETAVRADIVAALLLGAGVASCKPLRVARTAAAVTFNRLNAC